MSKSTLSDRFLSNGIRFSITDVGPPATRALPIVHEERLAISLYDVQNEDGQQTPIPDSVIDDVVNGMRGFRRTCQAFGVNDERVRWVATEATRNAVNREAFLNRIEQETGWSADLLSKEEEGTYGAMGIASNISGPFNGLVIDMGGGSIQLMWVERDEKGNIQISQARSFPYGAAALISKMNTMTSYTERPKLYQSISSELESYFKDLDSLLRDKHKDDSKAYSLYLSGGGFRRWGHHMITADAVQPYPIPIVNGYHISGDRFKASAEEDIEVTSHRISKRGATQIPAVRFLIRALLKAIDRPISDVTFCQGGVREGVLYEALSEQVRAQDPLEAFTRQYGPQSGDTISAILSKAIPPQSEVSDPRILKSLTNILYHHSPWPKDIQAASALRSTTSGFLGAATGLTHRDRALLALAICERWGAHNDLPPEDGLFHDKLQRLLGPESSWWAKYLGVLAKGVADIYPAGLIPDPDHPHRSLDLAVTYDTTKEIITVDIRVGDGGDLEAAAGWAKELKKVGKKRNWVGEGAGDDDEERRWGVKVDAIVSSGGGMVSSEKKEGENESDGHLDSE